MGIATVTHLRGTQDFSVYGTRDKLDIAKVSLLIVRTCVSIGGIHLQGSSANQSAQNDYLLMIPEYTTNLESDLADGFYLCKKRWIRDHGCTYIFDAPV